MSYPLVTPDLGRETPPFRPTRSAVPTSQSAALRRVRRGCEPERSDDAVAESGKFLEVTPTEPSEFRRAGTSDPEAHRPMVVRVLHAADVSGENRAVDQPGGAVVA